MRIQCTHCHGRARISHRVTLSKSVADLYCACMDAQNCGHTFVMSLAFKHTVNPPHGQLGAMLVGLLRGMDEKSRQEILGQLKPAA